MKIRVLGSAAGGGFPQWNCNCRNCAGLRNGTVRAVARTQSSIAVSGDDPAEWVLINASPDILAQLQANPVLQPGRSVRDTAIRTIMLVDGQIDHTTGLFMLRESARPWPIFCTDSVYTDLIQGNPILKVLTHYCGVERNRIDPDGTEFTVEGFPGLRWRALALSGKPAPFSPNRESPVPGDNIALMIEDARTGKYAFYAPGLGEMDDRIWEAMQAAACVMVDGTFWTVSKKTARSIGHLPQSGAGGMIGWLDRLPESTRKILRHINNTNPILDEDSLQRADLARHGIEVAADGMEIVL